MHTFGTCVFLLMLLSVSYSTKSSTIDIDSLGDGDLNGTIDIEKIDDTNVPIYTEEKKDQEKKRPEDHEKPSAMIKVFPDRLEIGKVNIPLPLPSKPVSLGTSNLSFLKAVSSAKLLYRRSNRTLQSLKTQYKLKTRANRMVSPSQKIAMARRARTRVLIRRR